MFHKRTTNIVLIAITLCIAGAAIIYFSAHKSSNTWRSTKKNVLLQLMPADYKEKIEVLHRPFLGDVDVGVVIDDAEQYHFISPAMLAEWDITEEMLFEQASKNLNAISNNIKVEVAQANEKDLTTKYIIVELDDGYAATRILSDGVRKAIALELGDSYIAAIPTRDFLIFWHKDFPLFDAFATQVQTEYDLEEKYPLTPKLLIVDSDGIRELE